MCQCFLGLEPQTSAQQQEEGEITWVVVWRVKGHGRMGIQVALCERVNGCSQGVCSGMICGYIKMYLELIIFHFQNLWIYQGMF